MVEEKEDKEIQDGKIFALLGYLGILCLVPLLFKKDNKFALFHGKQGLVIFLGEIAAAIINIIPILGQILGVIGMLVFGILSLMGIVKCLMGEYWKIPVVSDIAEKIKI
jgi:fumarate reductase subunit D